MEGDVSFADRALYLHDVDALVLADLHLGRAAASSVDFPVGERTDLLERLASVLDRFDPATVVVAGDLLHSFASVPRTVETTYDALLECVEYVDATLVVVRGNHDVMLDDLRDEAAPSAFRLDDGETLVCHGHERPTTDAARYVIGHDHPAIRIDGRKRPCFLFGPRAYRGRDVLMLPAFTRVAPGTTINRARPGDLQSPLVADLDAFLPVVRDEPGDETLWFPPLGECRRVL